MPRVFRHLTWLFAGVLALVALAGGWRGRRRRMLSTCRPLIDRLARARCCGRKRSSRVQLTRRPGASSTRRRAAMERRRSPAPSSWPPVKPAANGVRQSPGHTEPRVVVPGCAPSLLEDPFAKRPSVTELIDHGWVYVATDYVGLGKWAPPLSHWRGRGAIGVGLDRACVKWRGSGLAMTLVVWGHSQGGHAALWTGVVAPGYAPDVNILGVAAIAPASDSAVAGSMPSRQLRSARIMSAIRMRSYAAAYPDVEFDAYVPGWKRWAARDISGRCLAGREALFSVAEALLARR